MKTNFTILLLCLFLFSCGGKNPQAKLEKLRKQRDELTSQINKLERENIDGAIDSSKNNLNQVAVTGVFLQPFNHYIEVQGKLDGDENVAISPKTGGVVISKYVNEGSLVRKGQILAQLDNSVMLQQLKELENALDFATDAYLKQKSLWDQKIGTEMQYLKAKNDKESLEKRIVTLKDQIDMTRIKSPINGTVEEVNVKIGQMLSPTPNFAAFRVVNLASVKVTAEVAEAYTSKIKKGDQVILRFPDINREVNARISFASKYINPVNRTFVVEARFPKGMNNYKANMIAVLRINDYKNSSAIVLPVNVVQSDVNGDYVFVAQKNTKQWVARRRAVKPGQTYNGLVEITKGLSSGEKVITSGYQDLEDNEKVNF